MKVLFYTKKIYEPEGNLFIRDRSGIALFVHEIAKSIQNDVDIHVLTSIPCKGVSVGNVHYVRYNKLDFISCCTPKCLIRGIRRAFALKGSVRSRLKEIYWEIDKNYFKKVVKREAPDLVHIHGVTLNMIDQAETCKALGVPCIVTLHGLIGLDDSVSAPEELKEIERQFVRYADENNVPVTVISTGIKNRIEKYYLGKAASNLSVITNATEVSGKDENKELEISHGLKLRKLFNISNEKKICLAIGSLDMNKNQMQIIDAFGSSSYLRNQAILLLCGADKTHGVIERYVNEQRANAVVRILGFVQNEVVKEYLRQADLNILASKCEGFGISIIEAFAEGVPSVTFSDLDAIPDLYDEKTMLLAKGRSTEDLSTAIETALKRDWDKEYIKEYAKRFSLEEMASQYLAVYRQSVKK